eukprot:6185855-Pleurochrysis_carterae.AAC.4
MTTYPSGSGQRKRLPVFRRQPRKQLMANSSSKDTDVGRQQLPRMSASNERARSCCAPCAENFGNSL